MSVSRETGDRLNAYADLLMRWNKRINLVAPGDLVDLSRRHIDDGRQVSELVPEAVSHWADLGSGGGLPGLVVAILRSDQMTRFTLVESDARKAVFLRQVCREVSLDRVRVLNARVENVPPLNASIVSARALAPLPKLMPYVMRHLSISGRALLPKGRNWRDEVAEAGRQDWVFECLAHPSRTQDGAAILELSGISHGAKQDHRHCQPEGGRGQDHHGGQPRGCSGHGRTSGDPDRPRSSGERLDRLGDCGGPAAEHDL